MHSCLLLCRRVIELGVFTGYSSTAIALVSTACPASNVPFGIWHLAFGYNSGGVATPIHAKHSPCSGLLAVASICRGVAHGGAKSPCQVQQRSDGWARGATLSRC